QPDAEETRAAVQAAGRECVLIPRDISSHAACEEVVAQAARELGRLDVLVSNAAHQMRKESPEAISDEELDLTFRTNVYAAFWLTQAALPHMGPGSSIIVSSSETGLIGNAALPDYSAT